MQAFVVQTRRRSLPWVFALLATFLAVLSFPAASAAAPVNDDFGMAQALSGLLPIKAMGSNEGATLELEEQSHVGPAAFPADSSVWYSWTPTGTGEFVADACTANYNSVLDVYTGNALSALSNVGEGDSRCRVEFSAIKGTTYRIVVDGSEEPSGGSLRLSMVGEPTAHTGQGEFTLEVRRLDRPANDDFSKAQRLSGPLPISISGSSVDALDEEEEPEVMFYGLVWAGSSVWYAWTPNANGRVLVDTCGSGFDTVLAVYSGVILDRLIPVVASDDGCGLQSRVSFDAAIGVEYRIGVYGFRRRWKGAEQGPFTLTIAGRPQGTRKEASGSPGQPTSAAVGPIAKPSLRCPKGKKKRVFRGKAKCVKRKSRKKGKAR